MTLYEQAKAKYAALGIDVEAAMDKLAKAPVSLHCWQGDDVRGFDGDPNAPLTGGIQTTGNYPGRARTPEELMADLDMAMSLCPGTPKMNLHACYAIFDEENPWVDRDKLEPKHFKKWVDFCKERGLIRLRTSSESTFPKGEGYYSADHIQDLPLWGRWPSAARSDEAVTSWADTP